MAQGGGAFLPDDPVTFTNTVTFASAPTITSAGTIVGTTSTQTLTNKTLTAPTITSAVETTPSIASPVVTGDASSGIVVSKTVAFVEDATSTTWTGTVIIPAGATLVDIVMTSSVLWSKASAVFTCGDAQAATGWFTSCNLHATDLLVGERLSAAAGAWGGVNGVYLVAATGVMGQATASKAGPYYVTAGSVIGVVTATPGSGAAGRSFMTVSYAVGQAVAAVLA